MLNLLSRLAVPGFFVLGSYASIGPIADIHVANEVIAPDGYSRDTVLVEGTFPGPTITGQKGDNFQLTVYDDLTDTNGMLTPTSIHWHGLFQHTTNYADGVASVTQCPISPGHSFLYNFTPDQTGTFWYHSHVGNQYCDGLRGVFVIYDPEDPYQSLYDVDDESTVITLADWYHYLSLEAPFIAAPNSTLINGLGRYVGGPSTSLAVVNVEYGLRYRFRLVSISCDPNFVFSIDGHSMTIIEVDGYNVEPLAVDSIQIYAGQRYSFILNANQTVDNYWIRALSNEANSTTEGGISSAILRYDGAPLSDPATAQTASVLPMVETDLHPIENPAAPGDPIPGGADITYTLNSSYNATTGQFAVNGVVFHPPTIPVLLQILSGAQRAQDLLPSASIYALEPNKSVELIIPGGVVGGGHPIHLHGHGFSVVRSAGNSSYNWDNPVRRDVVNIGTSTDDEVTIRFSTDNPGPWILHCHIDWHLNFGFAVVLAEDVADVPSIDPTPEAWSELCPIYEQGNFTSSSR